MINQLVSTVFYINRRLWSLALILLFFTSSAFLQVKSKEQIKAILAKRNNPGHPANNFSYTMPDGRKKKLYEIDAKHTLLFFYNPECDACKRYKDLIVASRIVDAQIRKGTLKVLAVYIDKDLTIWKKHLPEMPKSWIHGRDENEYLYKNNIYDLHAIPTIYLLGKNKKVILKDVLSISAIEQQLLK